MTGLDRIILLKIQFSFKIYVQDWNSTTEMCYMLVMKLKNKYVNRSKIYEVKFWEIINLFS